METVTTIGLGIARSGHEAMSLFWSLSGARRTSLIKAVMSAFDPRRTLLRGEAKKPAPPRYDHHEFFSLMKWRGTLVFPRRSLGRVPWGADPTTARKVGVSCSACPLTRGDRH